MSTPLDLDAYFTRIGYTGPRDATLDTLREIHRLHPQAIAFENLNPLVGWPVPLDAASLQAKLVHGERGGYCFEHNLLLLDVLRTLGFRAHGLGARVLWNAPPDVLRPRTHMLLQLEVDGERWIADVGFGGLTLTAPLRLDSEAEQPTPHEPFRLARDGDAHLLLARVVDEWKPLYRFDLQRQERPDYEMASWYLSSHPQSHFRTSLMAARTTSEGRFTMRDHELTRHAPGRPSERLVLPSVEAMHATLAEVFGVHVPLDADVRSALSRVCLA